MDILVVCGIAVIVGVVMVLIVWIRNQRYYTQIPQLPEEPPVAPAQNELLEEPLLLYHFRHAVHALLQLASVSPETLDQRLRPRVYHSNRKTLKKMPSGRRLGRQSLPRKNSRASLRSSTRKRILLDRSFCFAEHVHEWVLTGLGRVRFVDHAPVVFQTIRNQFGYSVDELGKSLEMPLLLLPSEGKSDALFFASQDRRILFKTLRGAEPSNLKAFLQDYISYTSHQPSTLLPRFLGMYTFERIARGSDAGTWNSGTVSSMQSVESILPPKFTVVAMAHVFDTSLDIHAKFDFKGSQLGRETLNPQQPLSMQLAVRPYSGLEILHFNLADRTLKEMDFHRLLASGHVNRLFLDPLVKRQLLSQLNTDVSVLQKRGFMDYSLLVGIHQSPKKPKSPPRKQYSSPSSSLQSSPRFPANDQGNIAPNNPTTLIQSAFSLARQWTGLEVQEERPNTSLEQDSPITTIIDIPKEAEAWQDEESGIPFHKSFEGGLRSLDLQSNDDVEFEVYYIGLIDILQRYNMAKWIEREIKRQKTQLFGRESSLPLANLFSNYPSQENQEVTQVQSAVNHQAQLIITLL